jgi:hypothetical protein
MTEDKQPNLDDIDPPDHQGGGGEAPEADVEEDLAIDPPDHQGGGS